MPNKYNPLSGLGNLVNKLLDKMFGSGCMSYKQVLNLLWPLFLDQFFMQAINLVNTSMIASYGPQAISAVSIISALNFFVSSVFISISTGCAVVVAQYCGRGEHESANKSAAQAVTSTLLISILISGALFAFANPLTMLLLGKGDVQTQNYGRMYLAGNAVSFPLFAIAQTVLSALRGAGNTRTSFFFSSGINMANVIFNIICLEFLRMGVYGLVVSVFLCRILFALLAVLYMLSPRGSIYTSPRNFFTINISLQKSIMLIAVPSGLEQLFFHGGRIVTQVFVVGFGTMSTTANAIAMTYNGLLMMSGNAISIALLTIAGQCIGMNKPLEARRYIWKTVAMGSAASALVSVVLLPMTRPFLSFYNLPTEAYNLAYDVCLLLCIGTPLTWSVSFITPSGLRAAGDGNYSTVISLICMWAVRVGVGYVLGVTLGIGLYGIWIGVFCEWAVRGIIFSLRTQGSKWYTHKVIPDS